jgi:anion-transporting  ArsA/GET3 family ATPase
MFSKTTFAAAFVLATASGALAATKLHSFEPRHDVYDTRGAYVGSDPDANVRFELRRDWDRGNGN